jgi:hypothetical protein
MLCIQKIRYKNILSSGNQFIEIELDSNRTTICRGINGSGKCVGINTKIRLRNKKTGEIIETTIGEFYEIQKEQDN